MIPNVAKKGTSFKGVVAYITHDPDKAKSSERVLFTDTANMRTNDPEKAAKVMAYTAIHAKELKEISGIKSTGRKTDKPVYHVSLSWVPSEDPSQGEMLAAGHSALKELGLSDHEAVFAAHGDKGHKHLHIVINRINPITGKTVNLKDDYKKLQAWGHAYDKARGLEHHTPNRAKKYEVDFSRAAANDNQKIRLVKSASLSRRQWEAQKDAPYPKSEKFRQMRADDWKQVNALLVERTAMRARHKEESQSLKVEQAKQLRIMAAEFRRDHRRAEFHTAARGEKKAAEGLFKTRQKRLSSAQKTEFKQVVTTTKEQNASTISAFSDAQREARQIAYREIRAGGADGRKSLKAVLNTPLDKHDQSYRGHLARVFKDTQSQHAQRLALRKVQAEQKKEFLDAILKPELDKARQLHDDQHQTLKAQAKAEALPLTLGRQKFERFELRKQQQRAREEMMARQEAEGTGWAERADAFNTDRDARWQQYRDMRSAQERGEGAHNAQKPSSDRSGEFNRTADPGRSSDRVADPGRNSGRQQSGTGREIKR